MKTRLHSRENTGFTLVEMLVGTVATSLVAIGIFALIYAGSSLAARNLALNLTTNQARKGVDRVIDNITQGYDVPTLIDTSGNTVNSGSAAGVKFNKIVGYPYVVSTTANLPSTTTSLTIVRSTDALASPAIPAAGDIIRIDGTASTLMPIISTVTAGSTSGGQQTITVALTAQLGTAIPKPSTSNLSATIIRPVAYLVMPSGSNYELRYYSPYSTAVLNNSAYYTVLTNQISTSSTDITPFSSTTIANNTFIKVKLAVRASNFDQWLKNRQADSFNSYARVDSYIRPKNLQ